MVHVGLATHPLVWSELATRAAYVTIGHPPSGIQYKNNKKKINKKVHEC
jgi:hypothetical protein